ncbi:MAG: ribonuclease P [Euryarchaeota archaeon]|nr:ribonuclease P [Euryarchaeota archaeon]|tara:strand:- start:7001 stop:7261 length:261 start_codon:yes stop_codon:yes gene_type:complete
MMMSAMHMPWLSRKITVVESLDPTLVGLTGTVLDETRRTIRVLTDNGRVRLAKNVITFRIDSGEVIEGSSVTQRPEDRINRRYRRD